MIFWDKVEHLDQIVVYRASRETSKQVEVNMWRKEWPYPSNNKELKHFAKEWCKAQVPEIIFRL